MSDTIERITAYLSGGGMFNPELANHDAVRDLLIDCRAELAASTHKIISQRSSTGSERPTSNREVEGSTPSVEAALRAELAAETDTVMRLTAELSGVKACLKSVEKHFARAKGNTQSMKLSRNAARSERDELRALLREALAHIWPGDRAESDHLRARIDSALKGGEEV